MAFPPADRSTGTPAFAPTGPPRTPAAAGPPLPPAEYEKLVEAMAKKHGIDPRFALSIAEVESSFNPNAVSPKGARGLMQLMPDTARRLQVGNIDDPYENVQGGMRELQRLQQLHGGDLKLVARRYNGSPAASVFATDDYVQKVMTAFRRRAGLPAAQPGEDTDGRIPVPVQETTSDPVGEAWQSVKRGFDPTTEEGRRNTITGAGMLVLGPRAAALVPEAGATAGWIRGTASGAGKAVANAVTAAGIGAAEAVGEQVVAGARRAQAGQNPARPWFDPMAVASAGAEQGAYDLGGHLLLSGPRAAGRWLKGPGQARTAALGYETERTSLLEQIKAKVRDLAERRLDLTRATGTKRAAIGAASDARTGLIRADQAQALADAQARADALLGGATETTRRSVVAGEEQALTDVATATREGRTAQTQLADQFDAAIGQPRSESVTGRQVVDVLEGPGQAAHDILGQARDVAAQGGPPINMTRLQTEGRRLVTDEILPPERHFPSEVSAGPPVFNPRMQQAITDEELAAIARHPAMPIIDRILNAPATVPFEQLATWYKQLANTVDWENPAAGIVEGARKHLLSEMRRELAVHPAYNQAARAYEESYLRMKRGYAGQIAKTAVEEPARAVQMIRPDDPQQTQMLMEVLEQHSPQVVTAVREAWLQRYILRGGLEGLSQRLRLLHDAPEFQRALLGSSRRDTMETLTGYANAWDDLARESADTVSRTQAGTVVGGTSAAGPVTIGGRKGVEASRQLGADRVAAAREAGAADVAATGEKYRGDLAAEKTRTKAERARLAADAREQRYQFGKEAIDNGLAKDAAEKVTDEELLAIRRADAPAKTVLNAFFALTTGLHTFRGAMGLTKLLSGPRSGELLALAAKRPELNKFLVDWLANPNARITYQAVKRLTGTAVGQAVKPEWQRQSVKWGEKRETGRPPVKIVEPPPKPPAAKKEK